jgi:hypothetical protein
MRQDMRETDTLAEVPPPVGRGNNGPLPISEHRLKRRAAQQLRPGPGLPSDLTKTGQNSPPTSRRASAARLRAAYAGRIADFRLEFVNPRWEAMQPEMSRSFVGEIPLQSYESQTPVRYSLMSPT